MSHARSLLSVLRPLSVTSRVFHSRSSFLTHASLISRLIPVPAERMRRVMYGEAW